MATQQVTPLERRLEGAKTGMPTTAQTWDITELRQNLKDDSAALEHSLREANKLMDTPKNASKSRLQTGGIGADKTFITALAGAVEENTGGLPIVDGNSVSMSQRLASRITAMSQALGVEGMKLLQGSVQDEMNKVCKIARETENAELKRAGLALEETDLQKMFQEEVKLRTAAQESNKLLQEQLKLQTATAQEFQDRLAALEGTTFEGGEEMRKRELEMKGLKEEVMANQIKTRTEETERLKVLDRLRKKEVEMGKGKEVVDKLTIQLQKVAEERDTLTSHLHDIKIKYHDVSERNDRLQNELQKLQSAERVLRRNLQLQMPEEFRRVTKRVEDLERVNKEQETKIEELEKGHASEVRNELVQQVQALSISNKALEDRAERLKKEKDAIEKQWSLDTRLLANRGKQLFDKTVEYTQKLQGEVDERIVERLRNRSSEKELTTLRKRNMDLLGQVHSLDEAKMTAEKTAREAMSRCKMLQEKLDLFATLQKVDLSKMQFGADARTEDEVDLLFPAHAPTKPRSRPSSAAPSSNLSLSRPPSSRPPSSTTRPASAQRASAASTRPASAATERLASHTKDYSLKERPTSAKTTYGGERPVSAKASAVAGVEGRNVTTPPREHGGGREEDVGGLRQNVMMLQAKLQSEEKARVAAQERVITLAEQLLEKEKDISRLQSQLVTSKSGKGGEPKKKSERMRELEAQNMALLGRLRETEMDKEQLSELLAQRTEEARVKARKISDLLFRVEVLSETKARLEEEVAQHSTPATVRHDHPPSPTGLKSHSVAKESFAPPATLGVHGGGSHAAGSESLGVRAIDSSREDFEEEE